MSTAEAASTDLAIYMRLCGITTPAAQIAVLDRHYCSTLLEMLRRSNLASRLSAMDVADGGALLRARLGGTEAVQP